MPIPILIGLGVAAAASIGAKKAYDGYRSIVNPTESSIPLVRAIRSVVISSIGKRKRPWNPWIR